MVNWTILETCTCLGENDLKIYTTFIFGEYIYIYLFKKLIYKSEQFMLTKTILKNPTYCRK
jgi:hypothetical protein